MAGKEKRRKKIPIACDPVLQDCPEFNIQTVTCETLQRERPDTYRMIVEALCYKRPHAWIAKQYKVSTAVIKSCELTEELVIAAKMKEVRGKLTVCMELQLDLYTQALRDGNVKVDTIPLNFGILYDKNRLESDLSTQNIDVKTSGDEEIKDFIDNYLGEFNPIKKNSIEIVSEEVINIDSDPSNSRRDNIEEIDKKE